MNGAGAVIPAASSRRRARACALRVVAPCAALRVALFASWCRRQCCAARRGGRARGGGAGPGLCRSLWAAPARLALRSACVPRLRCRSPRAAAASPAVALLCGRWPRPVPCGAPGGPGAALPVARAGRGRSVLRCFSPAPLCAPARAPRGGAAAPLFLVQKAHGK